MNRIDVWCFRIAVIYFLIGIALGNYMGMVRNFELASAHAHINLLGWTSFMLFGFFYRSFPQAAASTLAKVQFWSAALSVPFMVFGLAFILLGYTQADAAVGIGSAVIAVSGILFAVILFRATR